MAAPTMVGDGRCIIHKAWRTFTTFTTRLIYIAVEEDGGDGGWRDRTARQRELLTREERKPAKLVATTRIAIKDNPLLIN